MFNLSALVLQTSKCLKRINTGMKILRPEIGLIVSSQFLTLILIEKGFTREFLKIAYIYVFHSFIDLLSPLEKKERQKKKKKLKGKALTLMTIQKI